MARVACQRTRKRTKTTRARTKSATRTTSTTRATSEKKPRYTKTQAYDPFIPVTTANRDILEIIYNLPAKAVTISKEYKAALTELQKPRKGRRPANIEHKIDEAYVAAFVNWLNTNQKLNDKLSCYAKSLTGIFRAFGLKATNIMP